MLKNWKCVYCEELDQLGGELGEYVCQTMENCKDLFELMEQAVDTGALSEKEEQEAVQKILDWLNSIMRSLAYGMHVSRDLYSIAEELDSALREPGSRTEAHITKLDEGSFEAFCEKLDEPAPQSALELLSRGEDWV